MLIIQGRKKASQGEINNLIMYSVEESINMLGERLPLGSQSPYSTSQRELLCLGQNHSFEHLHFWMSREYQHSKSKTPQPFSHINTHSLAKTIFLETTEIFSQCPVFLFLYIPQKARTLLSLIPLDSNLHLALYSAFSDSVYYFSHFLKIFH